MQKLVVSCPDGRTFEVDLAASVTIGRAPENDLVLDDPRASRRHAAIRQEEDGGYTVMDLGSANGTLLNGMAITLPARVMGNAVLEIGATKINFPARSIESEASSHATDDDTTLVGQDRHETAMIGSGPPMVGVFQLMANAARSPIPVLIEGETGTGKELVANAIHETSERAKRPFVAVNCAAVSESLIESELFGHRRGAFTGAAADHRGLFETANGGTIFLDEIGEMPLAMQPKLLRVLEEGEILVVGETRPRKIDVRLISATNRDLLSRVEEGGFRRDLYFRLSAFPIRLPPLRERVEDIPLLVNRFLAAAARHHGKRVRGVEPSAMGALVRYDWPGNVRELRNEIQRAVALVPHGDLIRLAHLSARLGGLHGTPGAPSRAIRAPEEPAEEASAGAMGGGGFGTGLRGARAAFEARYIAQALRENGEHVGRTARALGMSRVGLHKKLKEYGLR